MNDKARQLRDLLKMLDKYHGKFFLNILSQCYTRKSLNKIKINVIRKLWSPELPKTRTAPEHWIRRKIAGLATYRDFLGQLPPVGSDSVSILHTKETEPFQAAQQ